MGGLIFLSNLITPTYRREGDLDGRYNPQAYRLAMEFTAMVKSQLKPELLKPLTIGLGKINGGLRLVLLERGNAELESKTQCSNFQLTFKDTDLAAMQILQKAWQDFAELNPPKTTIK
ncbi:UNVERIFIED_ORG: hypothetical protein M2414_005175 [Rahnella aquatilis]